MNEEVIEIGQPEQEFTEYTEVVEEVQPVIDYTPVIYEGASYISSIILFSVFVILGFFSAIQLFGRTRS